MCPTVPYRSTSNGKLLHTTQQHKLVRRRAAKRISITSSSSSITRVPSERSRLAPQRPAPSPPPQRRRVTRIPPLHPQPTTDPSSMHPPQRRRLLLYSSNSSNSSNITNTTNTNSSNRVTLDYGPQLQLPQVSITRSSLPDSSLRYHSRTVSPISRWPPPWRPSCSHSS